MRRGSGKKWGNTVIRVDLTREQFDAFENLKREARWWGTRAMPYTVIWQAAVKRLLADIEAEFGPLALTKDLTKEETEAIMRYIGVL